MSNTRPPEPKPMPTTGMPDRNDPLPRSDLDMKKGARTMGDMQVTNGRKPGR